MQQPSTGLNATTAAFSQTTRTNQFTATYDSIPNGEKNQGHHMSRMTDEPGIFTPHAHDNSLEPRSAGLAITPASVGNTLDKRN